MSPRGHAVYKTGLDLKGVTGFWGGNGISKISSGSLIKETLYPVFIDFWLKNLKERQKICGAFDANSCKFKFKVSINTMNLYYY